MTETLSTTDSLAAALAAHVEEPHIYSFPDGSRGRRCSCKRAKWSHAHVASELAPILEAVRAEALDKDRRRGTGGNLFIPPDATTADLLKSINDQLGDLREWASESGLLLDVAEISISTQRIRNGRISVMVTADLARSKEAGGE